MNQGRCLLQNGYCSDETISDLLYLVVLHGSGTSTMANARLGFLALAPGRLALEHVTEVTHLGSITISIASHWNGQFRAIGLSEDVATFIICKQIDNARAILALSSVGVHVTTLDIGFFKANKLVALTDKVDCKPAWSSVGISTTNYVLS